VQVGIRTMNAVQADAVRRFSVECVSPEAAADWPGLHGPQPVYVSIDLDALDPAFAPGVSHHEPGGLTVREVLAALRKVTCPIVGADIVELNPDKDQLGITAAGTAKILKEIAGKIRASRKV
jgi:arginase family enzyme